ncbi:hypothetical protein ACOMHN_046108 [Nucella lapillus]
MPSLHDSERAEKYPLAVLGLLKRCRVERGWDEDGKWGGGVNLGYSVHSVTAALLDQGMSPRAAVHSAPQAAPPSGPPSETRAQHALEAALPMDHSPWTTPHGPHHMDHSPWTTPLPMDHSTWTTPHGPLPMDHSTWTTPLPMDHSPWTTIPHGPLSKDHSPWTTIGPHDESSREATPHNVPLVSPCSPFSLQQATVLFREAEGTPSGGLPVSEYRMRTKPGKRQETVVGEGAAMTLQIRLTRVNAWFDARPSITGRLQRRQVSGPVAKRRNQFPRSLASAQFASSRAAEGAGMTISGNFMLKKSPTSPVSAPHPLLEPRLSCVCPSPPVRAPPLLCLPLTPCYSPASPVSVPHPLLEPRLSCVCPSPLLESHLSCVCPSPPVRAPPLLCLPLTPC